MPYLEKHAGLYTDRYELTMAQAHYLQGRQDIQATFDYFFRKVPYQNSYVIFTGLADLLETLERFSYESEDLAYLQTIGFSPHFLDYLAGRRALILATGAGAISRYNMGLVIASGLSIGTLFTLFVVPAMYMLLAAEHEQDQGPTPTTQNTQD